MAISLNSTKKPPGKSGALVLVYGPAGVGKTRMFSSVKNVALVDAEGKTKALAEHDIPMISVSSWSDIVDVYPWLMSEESARFSTVGFDSISEIADRRLAEELRRKTNDGKPIDGRQAYQLSANDIFTMLYALKSCGKNIVFTARLSSIQDEVGRVFYGPEFPGNKTAQKLPHYFDHVLALRVLEGGKRAYQCHADGAWMARDDSNKLEMWEPYLGDDGEPRFGELLQKIGGL